MKHFETLLVFSSLIFIGLSFTCTNEGSFDRDIRFNETTYSYCYHIPTTQCNYGTFIPLVNHTCRLLSVRVNNHSLVTPDYMGSERCGCIDPLFGHLVMLIDANPSVVQDSEWELRIIDTIDWFYHGVTQERMPGSNFNITYLFLHGDSYFETNIQETYNVFSGDDLTSNPWSEYASTEAITNPCNAINRAIDILDETPLDYHSRRRLFYWGFSTPDLTNCDRSGRSFQDISTYAVRQTLSVNLNDIESTYGSFSQCNWYQSQSNTYTTDSQAIQNRAIIGTLSDFLCAIEETPAPSTPPTSSPILETFLPEIQTPPPTLRPTLPPTLPPTLRPTSFPTWPPTINPTLTPTQRPISPPTSRPTSYPTFAPTQRPTAYPTLPPTSRPTSIPTLRPTFPPTLRPTLTPTLRPTLVPTSRPTSFPTSPPTLRPTSVPTIRPTSFPTLPPTLPPTLRVTSVPTTRPTSFPSSPPTLRPTSFPSSPPTLRPTSAPTLRPTSFPTLPPTLPPTLRPTSFPTLPPTLRPTSLPTTRPTLRPTSPPTSTTLVSFLPATETPPPTSRPTSRPTSKPTSKPTSWWNGKTSKPTPKPTRRWWKA